MITIYHNPRCRKSHAGLAYLESKGVDFSLCNYFKEPFTEEELKEVLKKLGVPAREMIRTQETEYKQLYKGKDLSEEDWIQALLKHPKLFKRPVVVKDDKAVWADPPEKMDILF
jgi:arsenate reductase (glutaredoxin)